MPLAFHKRNSETSLTRFLPATPAHRAKPGYWGEAVCVLSEDEFEIWQRAANQLGGAIEHLLIAAVASLLSRLTRHETLTIDIACKRSLEIRLEADASIATLVRAIRQPNNPIAGVAAGGAEQESPSIKSTVFFDFDSPSETDKSLDGSPSSSYGLYLRAWESGRHLSLSSPTRFWPEDTLREWLGYLRFLLTGACCAQETPINRLPLWDATSAREFYDHLNATATEFPGQPTVSGRISAQARRRGNATAVIAGTRRYSYQELDERSALLARHLVTMGAGPGRPIAVCMERTVDLVLALVAVLKSGSCYLPLDPSNPRQRLQGILEECQPVAVLTDQNVLDITQSWLDESDPRVVNVERPLPALSISVELPELSPDDPVYIIYTSGTTGKPKGVPIHHRGLLNLVCSMWSKPGMTELDRTLTVAPVSFDAATMDIFVALSSGGTLVVASRTDAVDPYRLQDLLDAHDITYMLATPATWRMLLVSGWKGKANLKISCGGEALSRELANELLTRGRELWNCYGPTETSICSAVVRVEPGTGPVSVGPPMANTSFYVLDTGGNLLPPGIAGELCIGGVGVSYGYLNRPELTAQRFIPDPFSSIHGSTLFRTGDIVRLTSEGLLEFFGRADHQVKLRGFRIELGEIESVLRGHPSVSDVVVILREDIPGEPRLVAYIVPAGPAANASALSDYASALLPVYMLPSVFVSLASIPLSSSGKVDRRALPIPESIPAQVAPMHPSAEDPADELETRLLKIFREVLRNNAIGVTDNFFRFGGYSVLTVKLFSRIDRDLHARLPISLLFDAPTVRELARVVRSGIVPPVIVPIRPYGRSAPVFLVQSYLLYNVMLEMIEPDRPIYGVREMGNEHEPISITERAAQFAQEILKIHPTGPLYLAGWCAAGTLTVEIARQLREAGHQVGLVALFDAERPGFSPPQSLRSRITRLRNKIRFHADRLRHISWQARRQYIFEALERNWEILVDAYYYDSYKLLLWLQERFGISFPTRAFHHVQANMSAQHAFSVEPYPGRLNLYRAADVPDEISDLDLTLGWGSVAHGGVTVEFVPGDHVSMFKKPHVDSLARLLQREMRGFETAAANS